MATIHNLYFVIQKSCKKSFSCSRARYVARCRPLLWTPSLSIIRKNARGNSTWPICSELDSDWVHCVTRLAVFYHYLQHFQNRPPSWDVQQMWERTWLRKSCCGVALNYRYGNFLSALSRAIWSLAAIYTRYISHNYVNCLRAKRKYQKWTPTGP